MKSRTRLLFLVPLLFLVGCRAVAILLMIPIAITAVTFGGLAAIFVGAEGLSDEAELYAGGIRIDQRVLEVEVDDDLTFRGSLVLVSTVTSTAGLKDAQQTSLSYDPRSQDLELVSAKVVNPDGSTYEVESEQIFVRPSTVAQGAPGFVNGLTMSVLYPQLIVGSQTHVEWRFEERSPSSLGFNYSWRPSFALPVTESLIRISYPEELPLRFDAQSPFEVEESTSGRFKVVEATLRNYEGQSPERAMVSPHDVCPKFVATTQERWEDIGAKFHEAVAGRIERTPEIELLAADIVGDKTGLDAARAIHRWVCENIHYVVVHLNQMDGWVPHPASEVLANRYGDCKDKYVLSASLLAARGIAAEPVLINLDRAFEPFALPTPMQFNHCMAYLPEFDLYSNPTDPYRDLGDLDRSLSDKFVVIASPEGRVARTPEGSADHNTYRVDHKVVVGSDGIVSGRSVMDFGGRTSGMLRRTLALAADPNQTADSILNTTAMGGYGELETTDPSNLDVPLHCEGEWTSDVPIAMASTLHFVTPSGIDLVNPQLIRDFLSTKERRYPILIAALEIDWSFEITLPDGFAFEELPAGRTKENAAGRYESSYSTDENGHLIVKRKLRIERDRFAAEQYADLRVLLLESVVDVQTILSASIRS